MWSFKYLNVLAKCINHDIVVGLCSELLMRLSYYIHLGFDKVVVSRGNRTRVLLIMSILLYPYTRAQTIWLLFLFLFHITLWHLFSHVECRKVIWCLCVVQDVSFIDMSTTFENWINSFNSWRHKCHFFGICFLTLGIKSTNNQIFSHLYCKTAQPDAWNNINIALTAAEISPNRSFP